MSVIASYGEMLWDLLPGGAVLGGAPFNFIYRMNEFGHDGIMISALGTDPLGDEAYRMVQSLGLNTDFIQRKHEFPTGTVKINFDKYDQPEYEIRKHVAYDQIRFVKEMKALAEEITCINFGTLAQRDTISKETLASLMDQLDNHTCVKFLDINLREDCYRLATIEESLHRADILKLNDSEARTLAGLFNKPQDSLSEIASDLVQDWALSHCVVTMSEYGALCSSSDGSCFYDPGYAVSMIDPCGSGDAFSAGFIHELLNGQTTRDGCFLGNILGALVATQRGATQPITPGSIEQFVESRFDRRIDPKYESLIP